MGNNDWENVIYLLMLLNGDKELIERINKIYNENKNINEVINYLKNN